MAALLSRLDTSGPGPVFRSVIAPHDDPEVQEAAAAAMRARLVAPLEKRYRTAGLDRPRLRAEVAVAAFVGVVLSRTSGALPGLAKARDDVLLDLLLPLLGVD
jgi:hypothetical protein